MKIHASNSLNGNFGPFTENIPQDNSMSTVMMIALGALVPVVVVPLGIWGIQALKKYKRDYDEKVEWEKKEKMLRAYMNGHKEEYDFPIYKVTFCVTTVIILMCKSWEIKDWIYSEGLWTNVTHLNSDNISRGLSQVGSLVHENVTNVIANILNLPQCYLNETPITKASLLLPTNSSEFLKNISVANSTVTDVFNGTINATKNHTGISFNLTEFTKSMSLWFENFSFQGMVSAQVPSFDLGFYFDFKTITTTITQYASNISVWARNIICETFAIENC